MCFGGDKYIIKDEKIYSREQIRLRFFLEVVKKKGFEKIIVMFYYFLINEKFEEFEFIKIIKEYVVEKVIYGYLYGFVLLGNVLNGYLDGIEYILLLVDYIDFNLRRIL